MILAPKVAALSALVMFSTVALDEKSTITLGAAIAMVVSTWRMGRKFQKFLDSQKMQAARLQRVEEAQAVQGKQMEEINNKIVELGRQRTFDIDNLRAELSPGRPAASPGRLKVLIVDDDPNDRLFFRRALSNLYAIDECESLSTALEKTRVNRYDCVLLDLYLPDSLPEQTVARFMSDNPTAVCMALSGSSSSEHVNQAIKQGAYSFIGKGNYEPVYLCHMIQNAINRKRLQ